MGSTALSPGHKCCNLARTSLMRSLPRPVRAIIIHGMGRTPLSMLVLATRLRTMGIRPSLFAYWAALERFDGCVRRFAAYIENRAATDRYILIGHSLGTVLMRATLPMLAHKPLACFMLAPPVRVSRAARRFAPRTIYQWLTGEMGRLLADKQFMASLPMPDVPTKIYAGTGGPLGRYSPFGRIPNDGVLSVDETLMPTIPAQQVASLHTFIMNSKDVAHDIAKLTEALVSST